MKNSIVQRFRIQPVYKHILLYGLVIGSLIVLLRVVDYQHLVRDVSTEIYVGIVAVLFALAGVWAGLKLTKNVTDTNHKINDLNTRQETAMNQSALSRREKEVLQLMAEGLSNQEIADRLFVSLNTIKSHISNLYIKLDVKRRTQAIGKAKSLGIID